MVPFAAPTVGRNSLVGQILQTFTKPQEVFAASTYTGNGSARNIVSGIDLLSRGGMVWNKSRSNTFDHSMVDTVRGPTNQIYPHTATAEATLSSSVTGFLNNGHSIGNHPSFSANGETYVNWSFARGPRFFDIITWTGDGIRNRRIPHGLGITPGFMVIKTRTAGNNWTAFHRSVPVLTTDLFIFNSDGGYLRSTAGSEYLKSWDDNSFILDYPGSDINSSGINYVAYVFAHDPTPSGIIQCGSFNGNATVNLGWQPQWLLLKRMDATEAWFILDTTRGIGTGSTDQVLRSNTSAVENTTNMVDLSSNGFVVNGLPSGNYMYTVIRSPT